MEVGARVSACFERRNRVIIVGSGEERLRPSRCGLQKVNQELDVECVGGVEEVAPAEYKALAMLDLVKKT